MPEWKEMTEQIHCRVNQPSQVACVSEDLKCWGAWDTTCGHKAKGITPSISWRREARKEEALDDVHWKDERRPSSIRQTRDTKVMLGNFRESVKSALFMGLSEPIDTMLNRTERSCRYRRNEIPLGCKTLKENGTFWNISQRHLPSPAPPHPQPHTRGSSECVCVCNGVVQNSLHIFSDFPFSNNTFS